MIAPGRAVRAVIKLEKHKRNLILTTTFLCYGRILSVFLTRIFLLKTNAAFSLEKCCMSYWIEQDKGEQNVENDTLSGWEKELSLTSPEF